MIEWERTDGSIPRSQRAIRSGCPEASSPTARRVFPSEAGNEEVGLVLSQEGLACLAEAARTIADPHSEAADEAADEGAAAVGGRDEDEPAHLWDGLVAERLADELAVLGRTDDLGRPAGC